MDDLDTAVASVRLDTAGFARDVDRMRQSLEGPLSAGADRAGRAIEASLLSAVKGGKLGFDDLGRSALSVLDTIAASALKDGIGSIAPAGGGGGGGLLGVLAGLLGSPGRATGGPVSPGQAYMVGERGPELFVPTASGRVAARVAAPSGAGPVAVSITINAPAGSAPAAMAQSSRQVARAVKAALGG